uniref:Receptor expression-enhancing protein n=1 Tax=Caenorhabditis japonica TaxID=281687 RepID=A0A8R1HXC0_CAEJA
MSSNTEKHPPPPPPLVGFQKFQADLVSYLYADHGASYNQNVKKLEETTGSKREYFLYGLVAVSCIYMIIGSWAEFVCNLLGIAYPAYVSVKAIRTQDTADDTVWLIYWAVFATFALIDYFALSIMSIFPFYWMLKALFLIYLYLPQTQGATVLYHGFVDPLVTAIDKKFALTNQQSTRTAIDENNNVAK